MKEEIRRYIIAQPDEYRAVCELLQAEIAKALPDADNKIWHAHPVWFLDGNPTVGFSIQKPGVRLMFWSGAEFDEPDLQAGTGKFKDASIFYQSVHEVNLDDLKRWCEKAKTIQWDYKNLIKNKGKLERLK